MNEFNLKKSKESPKDWHFSKVVNVAEAPKKDINLEDYIQPTLDQREVGFCHSFAAAAIKNAQELIETGIPYEFSPLYIAKNAKAIDDYPNEEGTDLLTICKVLNKVGAIEEKHYPFDLYRAGSLKFPEVEGEEKLPHFKWGNYARCDSLEDIRTALNMGKYALIGIQVTKDIYALKDYKGEDIPMLPFDPKGRLIIIGGHAIVGVKDCPEVEKDGFKGMILCKNSYGDKYGKNGFFYIPYEYFTFKTNDTGFKLTIDVFAPVDIENDPINGTLITCQIGSDKAYVNGREVRLTQPPRIDPEINRTLIGLRDVAELLGLNVYWNEREKKVIILKEEEKA